MRRKNNSKLKTISVIVPVHEGGKDFLPCMKALEQSQDVPDEIIVIVDGGWNNTHDANIPSQAKVFKISDCRGPAQARNLGAFHAKGDILFFIDADVTIKPNTLSIVLEAFKKNPHVSAIFGSYDDDPAAPNFLSQYRNLLHHYVHQTSNEDACTFWAGCGAIRREVFLEMGGFDHKAYRQPAIEDIELGFRLKAAGKSILLCKALQVKHLKRWGITSLLKADFFFRALPWTKLLLRQRHFINDLNLKTSSRISVMLTFGFVAVLLASTWNREFLIIAATLATLLLGLNWAVYKFFFAKRGAWFAVKTIPWHWFYYFYGGLAFAFGLVRHLFPKKTVQVGQPIFKAPKKTVKADYLESLSNQ